MRKTFRNFAVMLITAGLSVFVIMPSVADPEYGWHLKAIGVTPEMHQKKRMRGKGVVVGVFDSPANCLHETMGTDRCRKHFARAHDKACVTDSSKCNAGRHGAHVASIIASNDVDGEMVGVAPEVSIESWAICTAGYAACYGADLGTGGETRTGGDALDNFRKNFGMSVSNHSYGVPTHVGFGILPSEYRMMAERRNKNNVFVWAAGNRNLHAANLVIQDTMQPRDRLKNFIVVTNLLPSLELSYTSNSPGEAGFCNISGQVCLERNKFKYFTISAPGEGILAADPDEQNRNGYVVGSGTSMAAPIVTGVVALLQGYWPSLKRDASKVTRIIFGTAQDLGKPGVDSLYGWGLVRADRALSPIGRTYFSGSAKPSGGKNKPPADCTSGSPGSIYTSGSPANSCSDDTGSNIYTGLSGSRTMYSVAESQLKVSPALAALTQHSISFFDQYDRDFQMPLATYSTSYQGALRRWMERTINDGPYQVFDDGKLSARFSSLHYDSQDPKFAGIDVQMRYQPGDGSQFFFGQGSSLAELSLPGRLSFGLTSDKATRGGGYPVMSLAEGGSYLAAQWPTAPGWQMTGGVLSNFAFDGDAADRQYAPQAEALVFSLARASDDLGLAGNVSVTYLQEDDGVLGTGGAGGLSFTDESYSQGVTLGTTYQFGQHSKIAASYTHAWSRAESDTGQLLNLESSALNSSSFTIGLESGSIFGRADRLRFAVSQPLRVDGGKMRLTHDDYYDEDLVLHNRTVDIDLSPSGRQFDYQVEYTVPTAIPGSRVGLFGYFSDDYLHQGSLTTYGVGLRLGATF